MSVDLWVSVALAIPLAIVANIFTPKVQRWLDARASRGQQIQAAKRTRRRKEQLNTLRKELDQAQFLHSDKANLTHHYLDSLLRVAFYGAFGSIYGAIFVFLGEVGKWDGLFGILGRVGGQVTALFTAMLIFLTCINAARAARRAKGFTEYKERTEMLIGELERDGA